MVKGVPRGCPRWGRPLSRRSRLSSLNRLDEPLDAFRRAIGMVLQQDRPLCLVVQLQVHPVDGEIPALLLGSFDEFTPKTCRVVSGGESMALVIASSVVVRSTRPFA